ncbi:hypothetical protein ACTI_19060 [Actinoplanes sp. OR16]|uniref:outer membrane protein assembly factor BamB family protein n=1 Tax=Actinoplanes sp. OR16 TaxID=946334 RepID=UPI000F701207|nr:PQQ-binding-like beta-propeller repeat protein [Actinoplanes sp. OR16]BBH65221.1 hypothetical protein ACTI_19060 [Actinoplanes sp. OR16]
MRFHTLVLASILFVAIAPGPATAATPSWEHPGFDAEDSYYNPAESVINEGSVGRLTRRWSVPLRDIEASCSGFSRPLVTGGRAVTTDKLGISAYSITDGKPSWKFDWDWPDDNLTPSLAVSDGLLIAANGDCNSQSDPDGQLTALDLATGKARWKIELDTPVRSVVVDKGVVVISGWSPSDEEVVAGYRASDGKALWSKAGWSSSGVSLNGFIMMRKTDGFGVADGGTSAISVLDGSLRWSRLENWAAEAAFDGLFYVTDARGRLLAVDETDGAVLWSVAGPARSPVADPASDLGASRGGGSSSSSSSSDLGVSRGGGPSSDLGVSRGGGPSSDLGVSQGGGPSSDLGVSQGGGPSSDLGALRDGGPSSDLGALRDGGPSSDLGRALVAVDGRRIYRASSRTVEALDVRNGRRVWSARLGEEAGQPVRAGGLVYAGGVVLRASDGKTLRAAAYGSLIVSGGTVYGVRNSELVAFSVRR